MNSRMPLPPNAGQRGQNGMPRSLDPRDLGNRRATLGNRGRRSGMRESARLSTMRHMCEGRAEACTHACHFHQTQVNATKMESQVHETQGTSGIDGKFREIRGARVACVRVSATALRATSETQGQRFEFTHATSTKRMTTRPKWNSTFTRSKGLRKYTSNSGKSGAPEWYA